MRGHMCCLHMVWYNLVSTHTTFFTVNIGYCFGNGKWCPCGWQYPRNRRKSVSPCNSFQVINCNFYFKVFITQLEIFNWSFLKILTITGSKIKKPGFFILSWNPLIRRQIRRSCAGQNNHFMHTLEFFWFMC